MPLGAPSEAPGLARWRARCPAERLASQGVEGVTPPGVRSVIIGSSAAEACLHFRAIQHRVLVLGVTGGPVAWDTVYCACLSSGDAPRMVLDVSGTADCAP